MIAVPFCFTGLAPPAFTAPCRNQTGDFAQANGKCCALLFCSKNGEIEAGAVSSSDDFVAPLTFLHYTSGYSGRRSMTSERIGFAASRGDISGSRIGQSIASVGSFQAMPTSAEGS